MPLCDVYMLSLYDVGGYRRTDTMGNWVYFTTVMYVRCLHEGTQHCIVPDFSIACRNL